MVAATFKEAISKKADWVCIGLILALSGLFFLPAIVHSDSIIYPSFAPYSDLTVIHWPKGFLIAETFNRHGQLSLWTPLILSGMPLASNQLAMLFYPLSLLCLFLPANAVVNGLFVAHIFWAGAGLYLFMRRGLAASVAASFIAALSFMFSGKLLAHVAAGHASLVGALAWLPWALLCTHLVLAERKQIYSLFAGIVLALQATLHTQVLIYTAYTLLVYALFEFLAAPRQKDVPFLSVKFPQSVVLLLVPLPLTFLLVGAIQILPLIEMMGHSNRALSLGEASAFSLSWLPLLVGLLLPTGRGGHEMVIYLGLASLSLVPLAWRRRKNPRVLFFVGLAVFSFLFALGSHTPLFGLCYYLLPGFRWLRTPARAWFLLALATAILAGYGFDALTTEAWSIRARRRLTVGGMYAAFSCLLLGAGLIAVYGQASRATIGLTLLPVASLGLIILTIRGKLDRKGLALTMTLLLLADLWSFDRPLLLFQSPEQAFAPQREVAEYLASQEGLFRVYSPSYSLPQHLAARSGLQLVDGAEPVHLWRYDRFMALAGGYPFPGFSVTVPPFPPDQDLAQAHRDTRPNLTLLGLLNVRFLAAEFPMDYEDLTLLKVMGRTHVYENERALPRAFVVGQVKVISDEEKILSELALFDPKKLAILEEKPSWTLNDPSLFQGTEVTFYSPNRIVVQVNLSTPGLLVLSELWYPGWRAYDNSREVKIHRTNYLLRSVYLEEGQHIVEFVYDPLSVKVGSWISVGAMLSLAVYVVSVIRRQGRKG
ncbi:MAG: hypothetical protein E3J21_23180 [Anaerolineales bacterium]|nr:MAG: hypothetical protein E3J21_23180 [Anaerolineales bacterium]